MSFVYIWQYEVLPDAVEEFERIYSPGGEWSELFERSNGYERTELLRDADEPLRYITIDYWASREDHEVFRLEYDSEFEELDERCEALNESETFLGDFFSSDHE